MTFAVHFQSEPFTVIGVVSLRVANEPVIFAVEDYYMYTQDSSSK